MLPLVIPGLKSSNKTVFVDHHTITRTFFFYYSDGLNTCSGTSSTSIHCPDHLQCHFFVKAYDPLQNMSLFSQILRDENISNHLSL